GTPGASFAAALDIAPIEHVVRKGSDERIDSYSAFYDNGHRKATGLVEVLRERGVDTVAVLGLAADVCVAYSVHDALAEGFAAWVVEDGIRGVNMAPDDTAKAIAGMRAAGAVISDSDTLLRDLRQ
ncbi:MAG TPA: isochorismatase family protein, partial [Salinisphaeraceae bacterium]|nr:isochorismatase family protein [Salinisphaeraceae bacterium]